MHYIGVPSKRGGVGGKRSQTVQQYRRGFTLIELMLVIVVIMIIASIAIPSMLRYRLNSNEGAAGANMRTISTAEVAFQQATFIDFDGDTEGDYGTLANLADPDGGGATEPFIDQVLASGVKSGYIYTIVVTPGTNLQQPAYECTATPQSVGQSGFREFFVNESGVIRFTADGSPVDANSPPMN